MTHLHVSRNPTLLEGVVPFKISGFGLLISGGLLDETGMAQGSQQAPCGVDEFVESIMEI